MEFEVSEIKKLGYGFSQSLSLRLDAYMENVAQCGGEPPKARFTIHAVVPYSPEFGSIHIGDRFKFEKVEIKTNSAEACLNSTCRLGPVAHEFGPHCGSYGEIDEQEINPR